MIPKVTVTNMPVGSEFSHSTTHVGFGAGVISKLLILRIASVSLYGSMYSPPPSYFRRSFSRRASSSFVFLKSMILKLVEQVWLPILMSILRLPVAGGGFVGMKKRTIS